MKKPNWPLLLLSVVLAELIGISGAYFTSDSAIIYAQLKRPPLSPPSWIFGVVWPILYAFMGIAAYRVYTHSKAARKEVALAIYGLQLLVNFSWTIIFFRFGSLWGAVAAIILLDFLVVATQNIFIKIDRPAGHLLTPYILWLLFATYLAIGIAIVNK